MARFEERGKPEPSVATVTHCLKSLGPGFRRDDQEDWSLLQH